MNDPFSPVDDWLTPNLLNGPDDAAFTGEFMTPLEGYDGKLTDPLSPCISGDLDQFFQQPARPTSSMRTAWSMNDLQSLQLDVQPSWHPRGVSVKPSLESVPEGGLPTTGAANLIHTNSMYNQAADIQVAPSGSTHDGLPPTTPVHANQTQSHQPFMSHVNQFHHDKSAFAVTMGQSRPGTEGLMFPMPGYALGKVPLAMGGVAGVSGPLSALPVPAMPMMQAVSLKTESPASAHGFVHSSPEHQMPDAAKTNPAHCEAESSGTSNQQKLQPTAAALRKSHSALELGAWRKMATGDLDFIDPSVRETLQGLELCQQMGKLTPEERLQKILRYRAKRQMRNFNRTIKYQCRKSLADTRPRVRGRFARDNEPGSVLPHETKKAMREKTVKGKSPPPSQEDNSQLAAQGVKAASAPPAAPPAAPDSLRGFDSGSTFADGCPPVAEHHATALAHLYNQWSEVGASSPARS